MVQRVELFIEPDKVRTSSDKVRSGGREVEGARLGSVPLFTWNVTKFQEGYLTAGSSETHGLLLDLLL